MDSVIDDGDDLNLDEPVRNHERGDAD